MEREPIFLICLGLCLLSYLAWWLIVPAIIFFIANYGLKYLNDKKEDRLATLEQKQRELENKLNVALMGRNR
jgi:hypothetical protein